MIQYKGQSEKGGLCHSLLIYIITPCTCGIINKFGSNSLTELICNFEKEIMILFCFLGSKIWPWLATDIKVGVCKKQYKSHQT